MPLLLLLDSAVQCRKKKVNPEGNPLGFIEIRDSVAEGMLMCLEELFKKCYLGSVDQVCDFGIIFPYVFCLKRSSVLFSVTLFIEEVQKGCYSKKYLFLNSQNY